MFCGYWNYWKWSSESFMQPNNVFHSEASNMMIVMGPNMWEHTLRAVCFRNLPCLGQRLRLYRRVYINVDPFCLWKNSQEWEKHVPSASLFNSHPRSDWLLYSCSFCFTSGGWSHIYPHWHWRQSWVQFQHREYEKFQSCIFSCQTTCILPTWISLTN